MEGRAHKETAPGQAHGDADLMRHFRLHHDVLRLEARVTRLVDGLGQRLGVAHARQQQVLRAAAVTRDLCSTPTPPTDTKCDLSHSKNKWAPHITEQPGAGGVQCRECRPRPR